MKNSLVVKKNPLVNSRYKLNPLEMKIVLSVVGLIDKKDSDFWTYQIQIKDLGSHKEIKRSCRSLMTKVFEVQRDDDNWLMVNWFSSIEYVSNSGYIECSFDPKLKPYLLQIKDNFTSYTLQSVLPMKSTYSMRIYELLKQFEGLGSRTFNLDELQDILKIPNSYKVWRAFKRRVIEVAIREINHHSDIKIEYELIKVGRKITSISFKISPNLKELGLKQYISYIRSNFSNAVLLEAKDRDSGKLIKLSVSAKGLLYNQLNPSWKIDKKRSLEIWKDLYSRKVLL